MEDSCDLAGGHEFIDLIQSQRNNLMFKSGALTLFFVSCRGVPHLSL